MFLIKSFQKIKTGKLILSKVKIRKIKIGKYKVPKSQIVDRKNLTSQYA